MFNQLPGRSEAIASRMADEVQRVYSTLVTRVHRRPRTASPDELPVLIGALDLPVFKRDRSSSPVVFCNGGLHVHALALIPPESRLGRSLTQHFEDQRDAYLGRGSAISRIHVRPVVDCHDRVVDYVLKTVLNRRLSYDEAMIVLPRASSEVGSRQRWHGGTNRI